MNILQTTGLINKTASLCKDLRSKHKSSELDNIYVLSVTLHVLSFLNVIFDFFVDNRIDRTTFFCYVY